MRATLEIELQPFRTPNFALAKEMPGKRQEGFTETPKYPLSDLDPYTLDRLCRDFRKEVFKKAGKSEPPAQCNCGA